MTDSPDFSQLEAHYSALTPAKRDELLSELLAAAPNGEAGMLAVQIEGVEHGHGPSFPADRFRGYESEVSFRWPKDERRRAVRALLNAGGQAGFGLDDSQDRRQPVGPGPDLLARVSNLWDEYWEDATGFVMVRPALLRRATSSSE